MNEPRAYIVKLSLPDHYERDKVKAALERAVTEKFPHAHVKVTDYNRGVAIDELRERRRNDPKGAQRIAGQVDALVVAKASERLAGHVPPIIGPIPAAFPETTPPGDGHSPPPAPAPGGAQAPHLKRPLAGLSPAERAEKLRMGTVLNVPYERREEVKALLAEWDEGRKKQEMGGRPRPRPPAVPGAGLALEGRPADPLPPAEHEECRP